MKQVALLLVVIWCFQQSFSFSTSRSATVGQRGCTKLSMYIKSSSVPSISHIESRRFLKLQSSSLQESKSKAEPDVEEEGPDNPLTKYGVPIGAVAAAGLAYYFGQSFDINGMLDQVVAKIADMGVFGYIYFALAYIAVDILAIPAVALTASSGYLFGLLNGTLLVISCATIAASISFFIGRFFLRDWAQSYIAENPRWRVIDKAIAKEGFKVILLLRLSPLLPFALSNYVYGVTSVDFISYITATFFGFTPGSFGVVYFGSAGKALTSEGAVHMPWYAYLAGGAAVVAFGQFVAKYATDVIQQMEVEDQAEQDLLLKGGKGKR